MTSQGVTLPFSLYYFRNIIQPLSLEETRLTYLVLQIIYTLTFIRTHNILECILTFNYTLLMKSRNRENRYIRICFYFLFKDLRYGIN